MSTHDLFETENAVLAAARVMAENENLSAEKYRTALISLTDHYQRIVRESKRLIARSDRAERELNILNTRLQELAAAMEYKATHDPLTGIYNRGAIVERITQCLNQSPVALIVLDIDLFKRINDEFGHPKGDAVICELVSRVQCVLNGVGAIGRVGGEEFTIVLAEFSLNQAVALAEDIRENLNQSPLTALPHRLVTASFGVSWCPTGTCFDDAYGCADTALYEAKRQGRNRVMHTGICNPPSLPKMSHCVLRENQSESRRSRV
ncbi:MAG: GGDEF domain-containing protein [Formivibrio sp.]|nr:GGDEF domain-containing protein [Formivibrio sp.]